MVSRTVIYFKLHLERLSQFSAKRFREFTDRELVSRQIVRPVSA